MIFFEIKRGRRKKVLKIMKNARNVLCFIAETGPPLPGPFKRLFIFPLCDFLVVSRQQDIGNQQSAKIVWSGVNRW